VKREASERDRVEHGWCLQLKGSQAFAYYTKQLQDRMEHAHREVCAENSPSREYHAGRLAAYGDALTLLDKRYTELARIVEVVE